MTLEKKHWFWLLCLTQLIVWTLVPTFCRVNGPFDTIEGLAWGNQWQWGYDKHPPLAAWFTALATHLGGGTVGWPLYLLAQIAIVVAFWAIWRFANKIMSAEHALISVGLLQGIVYYTLITPKFNPTTLMTPVWALLTLAFYNALTTQKNWQWLLVGLIGGLSLITKYQSALLLVSMLMIIMTTREGRLSFRSKGFYAAIIVSLLVITPHLIWLYHHHFISFQYATDRIDSERFHAAWLNHVVHPVLFILAQAATIAPIFLLFLPFYFCPRATSSWNIFERRFLLWMGLGPFILTIILAVIDGMYLEPKWATPYFFLAGVLLVAWYKPIVTAKHLKYFLILVFTALFLTAALRALDLKWSPELTGKTRSDTYFPGRTMAEMLTKEWHDTYHVPLKYVAGDHYLVANFSVYSSDRPIPYFDTDVAHASWIHEKLLRQQGAVFIWFVHNATEAKPTTLLMTRFPTLKWLPVHYFNKMTTIKTPPVAIGVAFLPPES